jgi:preprotein translocase subunit SecG
MKKEQYFGMETYLDIGLIITSIALITFVVLQSRGSGLGGLVGGETGGIFSQRRGIERTLFQATIIISIIFFMLAIVTVIVTG